MLTKLKDPSNNNQITENLSRLPNIPKFCIGKRALKVNHMRSKCAQDTEF